MVQSKVFGMAVATLLILSPLAQSATVYFSENFSEGFKDQWVQSGNEKYSGRFVAESPEGLDDSALKVPDIARHYGISARLETPADPSKGLVLQYEVKLADGLTCGGAYLKFLNSTDFDPESLQDSTPYSVMFGPDKCGSTNKVHLILRYKTPSGEIEEKHLDSPPLVNLDSKTHVYTAILNADNTYAVLIDGEEKKAGSIFDDFKPSIIPAEEIDDPEDSKPEDWVDTPRIADPEATKPEDWDEDAPEEIPDEEAEKPEGWLDDEPLEIDDPEAKLPEDWDEEEDGEWEAPRIANPACQSGPGCGEWKQPTKRNPDFKGKWTAPLIENPAYKGPWAPRKIPNPDYFIDETPLAKIGKVGGVAIEIWTMDKGIFFDNVLITDSAETAAEYRTKFWEPKQTIEEEIQKKKDEEAKANAKDETSTAPKRHFADHLIAAFDSPPGSVIKPYLGPVFDLLESKPDLAYPIVGIPALAVAVILWTFVRSFFKGKPAPVTEAAQRKKDDRPTADDKPVKKSEGEIEEEEEDEDEDAGTTKRRTGRPRRE